MLNREDQEIYNYWAIRYDRISGTMTELGLLYLITTRLRYGDDYFNFFLYIIKGFHPSSELDIMHHTIFNAYYAAMKCGVLGNPHVLNDFEVNLKLFASKNNQERYWKDLRLLTYIDAASAFDRIFEMEEYRQYDPALHESYQPYNPKVILKDEVDDQGNIIYY